jgi:hypothetical protein
LFVGSLRTFYIMSYCSDATGPAVWLRPWSGFQKLVQTGFARMLDFREELQVN